MPVPDFESMMLPVLRTLEGTRERTAAELVEGVARDLRLSEADLAQRIPTSRQTACAVHVGWASKYLKEAGLVHSPHRGVYRITERGKDVLAERPDRIDVAYLKRFLSFVVFRWGKDSREFAAAVIDSRKANAGGTGGVLTDERREA